jgi:deazaflavin-dependent oxidoreductase (nitroreductase family)
MDINEMNRGVIEEFRTNDGKVGGQFEGFPILLLKTIGAKSGEARTNPLAYFPDGNRIIIIASFAGAEKNPPWYHNLLKNTEVGVELGTESYQARANVIGEPERTEVYAKVAAAMPVFADYQEKTARVIPLIVLDKIA